MSTWDYFHAKSREYFAYARSVLFSHRLNMDEYIKETGEARFAGGKCFQLPDDGEACKAFWDSRCPFPYRYDIPDLENQTSDAGWGCMIRVQQMAIAEALSRLNLFDPKLFRDELDAPLGIHSFCQRNIEKFGNATTRKAAVGSWLGPTSSAIVASEILDEAFPSGEIRGVAFEDGVIYERELFEVSRPIRSGVGAGGVQPSTEKWTPNRPSFPCVIWTCRMLGAGEVEPRFLNALKQLFRLDGFIGIGSGNEGASAYFFLGESSDYLFHLDPHRAVLPALTTPSSVLYEAEKSDLVKTCSGKLALKKVNPSMNLCFLVRSAEHWDALKQQISSIPDGLDLVEIMKERMKMPDDLDDDGLFDEENENDDDF